MLVANETAVQAVGEVKELESFLTEGTQKEALKANMARIEANMANCGMFALVATQEEIGEMFADENRRITETVTGMKPSEYKGYLMDNGYKVTKTASGISLMRKYHPTWAAIIGVMHQMRASNLEWAQIENEALLDTLRIYFFEKINKINR